MIAHLDQAERNQYNVELGKIKTVEMTHTGAPARGMVMVDKPNLYDPYIFRRGSLATMAIKSHVVSCKFSPPLMVASHLSKGADDWSWLRP